MAKFCTNCGSPLREGIAFCENCGTPVAVTEAAQNAEQTVQKTVQENAQAVETAAQTVNETVQEAAQTVAAPFAAAAQAEPSFTPPQPQMQQPQMPPQPQAPAYGQPYAPQQTPYYGVPAKKKTPAGLIVLIAILGVALIVVGAFFVRSFAKGGGAGEEIDVSNVGRPTIEEFDWAYDVDDSSDLPKGAKRIKDLDALKGTWKANLGYFDEDDEYMDIEELANIDIQSAGTSVLVTFDLYRIAYGDEWEDETDEDALAFVCEYDKDGTISGYGYGDLELYDFYQLDGKQYGFGDILLDDGKSAYILLVRP